MNILNKLKRNWAYVALSILSIGYLFFAYGRTMKINEVSDIHVFWNAGKMFLTGGDLYFTPEGLREFIYPPFAALAFTILGILPFKVATYLMFIINGILWFFSFKEIKKILNLLDYKSKYMSYVLWLSFFMSYKLFWNNIMLVQVNEIVFFLSLLGVRAYLEERLNSSILYIGVATSIKLTPILLFFWMVFRRWDLKFFLKCVAVGALAILIPLLLRGPQQGSSDFVSFIDTILNLSTNAEKTLRYTSQNIRGLVFRIFSGQASEVADFTIINLGEKAAGHISTLLSALLLLLSLVVLYIRRLKNVKISPHEIAVFFLLSHLIAGSTWKAHLVTLAFVFAIVTYDFFEKKRFSSYFFFIFAMLTALSGKALIGKMGSIYVGGYGIYVILMISLCLFYNLSKSDDIILEK